MSASRWLTSPLAGTAGVIAGLCLLAIPLRKLTTAQAVPSVAAEVATPATEIPAVLRIKLLAAVKNLRLETPAGVVLLEQAFTEAGESEHDVRLPFQDGKVDLIVQADFGELTSETAVFLTVMPDGHEELTRYATGRGKLEETLSYSWSHTH